MVVAAFVLPQLDRYQLEGTIRIEALEQPVRVLRGEDGVPYVYAQSLDDALTAQGFLHAQERLFQMELFKYLAHGRLAEFIGERGLKNDRLIRLVDISGFAARQLPKVSAEERNYLQRYLNGVNDYIASRQDEFPMMLGVMGHEVQPWTLEDILAIQYFRIWSSSVNWKQELLTLRLIDELGAGPASRLRPLTINPDDPATYSEKTAWPVPEDYAMAAAAITGGVGDLAQLEAALDSPWQPRYQMGSNAWATNGPKSANGKPILSNDPHLDARSLPGFWYPMGIVTPDLRAVGGTTPGGPGIGVGRTEHIAYGGTNGYSDMVDLYIETEDAANPGNYLQGGESLPFEVRTEELRILDREAGGYRSETMTIRSTSRGAIISDHGLGPVEGQLLSLRWSVPEYAGPDSGNRELLLATNMEEALAAIGKTTTPLSYIVVDKAGDIARVASGVVPLRASGEGLVPMPAPAEDNWLGRIPPEEMPRQLNPAKAWVGTTNHRVTEADYPYPYSTHFAGSWRYWRLMELMEEDSISADDHWAANLDVKNLLAERMRPAMLDAFAGAPKLKPLAELLENWDLYDTPERCRLENRRSRCCHLAHSAAGEGSAGP